MTSLGLYRARTCFSLIKEHRGDRCHMYRQCRHICVAVKFPRRVANMQQQQRQKSTQRHACRPVSCWDSALLSYRCTGCKTGVVIKLRLWSANHFFKNLTSSAVHLQDKKITSGWCARVSGAKVLQEGLPDMSGCSGVKNILILKIQPKMMCLIFIFFWSIQQCPSLHQQFFDP